MIRVLLADDHAVVRAGLRAILAAEPDIRTVAEATTGEEAQRLCAELQPDVLLLDLSMPGPSASDTVTYARLHSPATRVVVLTARDDPASVHELTALGAGGYVLKDDEPEAVVAAIRGVHGGGSWLSRGAVAAVTRSPTHATAEREERRLTGRERQLLGLLASGHDNARIAAELHLSEQTVRNYLTRLYDKIDVSSRIEAVAWLRAHEERTDL